MKRVIKATEKDIDKIIELIDKRIEDIALNYGLKKQIKKYKGEIEELKSLREKLRPLDVKLIIK